MTQTTVRQGRPADAPALTELCLASKKSNGYDDTFMALCVDELTVNADRTPLFLIAEDGRMQGCVCLEADGDKGTISAFFVHPDLKGQGIGRLLWDTVLEKAETDGLTSLCLDSDPAAEGFYNKIGFKTVRQVPSGSIKGRSLPHMILKLSKA